MLRSPLVLLCCVLSLASANLESTVYFSPALINENSVNATTVPLSVKHQQPLVLQLPSPLSNESLDQLYQLEGMAPSSLHFLRLTWSSLDPIDVEAFDTVEQEHDDGSTTVCLHLRAKFHCYSANGDFMAEHHPVTVFFTVSELPMTPQRVLQLLPYTLLAVLAGGMFLKVLSTLTGALCAHLYTTKVS